MVCGGVEKRAVLAQVIMCFGDPRMMDKRRCLQVMRNLLYFLNQGQTFTKSEAAAVLFSATKLFRFEDLHLKRLVYLIAGELNPIAEEAVMLESALLLDLFSIKYSYKSLGEKAVRLLSRITNVPSSIKVEEYLKVAIKSPVEEVSSAGLVCALHLLKKDPGIGIKICEQVGTLLPSLVDSRSSMHYVYFLGFVMVGGDPNHGFEHDSVEEDEATNLDFEHDMVEEDEATNNDVEDASINVDGASICAELLEKRLSIANTFDDLDHAYLLAISRIQSSLWF